MLTRYAQMILLAEQIKKLGFRDLEQFAYEAENPDLQDVITLVAEEIRPELLPVRHHNNSTIVILRSPLIPDYGILFHRDRNGQRPGGGEIVFKILNGILSPAFKIVSLAQKPELDGISLLGMNDDQRKWQMGTLRNNFPHILQAVCAHNNIKTIFARSAGYWSFSLLGYGQTQGVQVIETHQDGFGTLRGKMEETALKHALSCMQWAEWERRGQPLY